MENIKTQNLRKAAHYKQLRERRAYVSRIKSIKIWSIYLGTAIVIAHLISFSILHLIHHYAKA